MTMTNFSFEQYDKMSESDRIEHLNAHVEEETDLSEEFFLQALRFEHHPLAKWYLIKGLGIRESIRGISLIIQVCKEPEVEFGHTTLHAICAWSLGRIGQAAFAPVMDLLREADIETRRCAVDALGELKKPQAIETLCSCLERDEWVVQLWAGLSLAKIGEEAVPHLHQIITRSKPKTRLLALDAIIKIGSYESVPVLKQLLRNSTIEDKKFILKFAQTFHQALLSDIKLIAMSEKAELSGLACEALKNVGNKK
jgi:hypothetical protein